MVQNELQENIGHLTQSDSVSIGKKTQTAFFDKLNISRTLLFDIALFAGIGFLTGFLMRRFASFLVAFVLFCIALLIAQEMEIVMIQVNIKQLFQIIGIQTTTPISYELLIPLVMEWIRANVVVSIGAVIGFLLGLQAG